MLKYNINAFVVAEEVLGRSVAEIATSIAVAPKVTTIRALYWAGKLHENSKLKLSEAGEEMQNRVANGETLADMVGEICTAIEASGLFPKDEEQEEASDPQNSPASQ